LADSVKNTNTASHPNSKTFTVDAKILLEGDFGFSRAQIPRLVLAFYYPWYSLDSWKSPIMRDEPLMPYSSDSTLAISRHLQLVKAAGIDGFISSWWGKDDWTDMNLQKLLAVSEGMDFKVSIYFETPVADPSHARSEPEILSMMRYFFQTYGEDLRFFRLEGKPVLFIWAAETVLVDTWARVINTLRAEGHDAIYIAETLNTTYLEVFDGLHVYGPAFIADIDGAFQQASGAVKTYGWL
jgi:hypothetical protein